MHKEVAAIILETATRQLETTAAGKALIAAGMRAHVEALLKQIAANAPYGVCELFDVEG